MRNILGSLILLVNIIFSQRVVGYYPQWVVGNLPVNEIDLNVVTHVIHSFAWPNENGSISSYDGMFGSGISDAIHNQGAKFLLSLGGWGNREIPTWCYTDSNSKWRGIWIRQSGRMDAGG